MKRIAIIGAGISGLTVARLLHNYPFPVYIDPNNTFLKTNPFIPEDRRFRSFMIDREGNVIFVGDPTTSPKLRYLYNRIITNY